MAKCRALADENDQMGAELAEGKVRPEMVLEH